MGIKTMLHAALPRFRLREATSVCFALIQIGCLTVVVARIAPVVTPFASLLTSAGEGTGA